MKEKPLIEAGTQKISALAGETKFAEKRRRQPHRPSLAELPRRNLGECGGRDASSQAGFPGCI